MRPTTTAEQLARIRAAAAHVDEQSFVQLLRWYRSLEGLPDLDWGSAGSYRQGVLELRPASADELLVDLRRAARSRARAGRGADGKPQFAGGTTLGDLARRRANTDRSDEADT